MKKNEAIEVIKKNYPHVAESGSQFETALRILIPELTESEDERIIKFIKECIEEIRKCNPSNAEFNGKCSEAIAWLEKQSEQREQLINKACDLLVNCIEDFMFRRMEIWDEECKKQTLENIRKKLEE